MVGISAAIGGALSLGGALIGSSAAGKAATAQQQAAAAGIEEQRRQYDLTRGDLAPWREAGATALTTLSGRLSDLSAAPDPAKFRTDPGYEFAFDEGRRAIDSSAAARGTLNSGGTLKSLLRYGTGVADQAYGNWYGRELAAKDSEYNKLSGVATMGQNAAAQTGTFGAQKASSVSDLLTQQGNAKASGYVGQANAWQSGLAGIGSALKLPGF